MNIEDAAPTTRIWQNGVLGEEMWGNKEKAQFDMRHPSSLKFRKAVGGQNYEKECSILEQY